MQDLRTIRTRILTAVALLVPAVLLILAGGVARQGLCAIIVALMVHEYYSCFVTRSASRQLVLTGINLLMLAGYLLHGASGFMFGFSLAVMLTFIVFVLLVESRPHQPNFEDTLPAALIGLCYPGMLGTMLLAACRAESALILWLLVTVISTDTFAYFGGSAIGGSKLAARISPNKTISGTLCGLGAGVLASMLYAYFTGIPGHLVSFALFGFIAAVLAVFGDLAESLLKRVYGVKDTGRLLPGHGGILDRLDALLFAAPVLLFFA
ncbi:MAG TPA: phosphatidate cytidylyltransferase [Oligoflexia bacterium]|nr:phosphatidate cytidylyltransferase [Oligoflexia bacterium]